jgi:putative protease
VVDNAQVMLYLRERNVQGFVTLNVLVFDEELASVEKLVRHIAACGVDAVIVQACDHHQALTR